MKLVILDRDGVINRESDEFIKSEQEWEALPGALEALGQLYRHGYRIVIATNQSGIARGKLNMDDLNRIHRKMHTHAAQFGAVIEAIFICPHGPDDDCLCRKPRPGMYEDIAQRLRIELTDVPVIGDRLHDLEPVRAMGARPFLVETGRGRSEIASGPVPQDVTVVADLAAVAELLIDAG